MTRNFGLTSYINTKIITSLINITLGPALKIFLTFIFNEKLYFYCDIKIKFYFTLLTLYSFGLIL